MAEQNLHQQIGKLEAHVEALQKDTAEIKADIKKMSDQMNKWKGAGVILLIIGAAFGWLVDLAYKFAFGR